MAAAVRKQNHRTTVIADGEKFIDDEASFVMYLNRSFRYARPESSIHSSPFAIDAPDMMLFPKGYRNRYIIAVTR